MAEKLFWRGATRTRPVDLTSDSEEEVSNKRRKTEPPTELCGHCQQLDLDKSFEEAEEYYSWVRQGIVINREEPAQIGDGPLFYDGAYLVHSFYARLSQLSACPLCEFFRSMRVQSGQHTNYKLLAFDSSDSALFSLPRLKQSSAWNMVEHSVFMAVVPDLDHIIPEGHEIKWMETEIPAVGSIYRLRPDENDHADTLLRSRLLSRKTDFSILKQWYSFCKNFHDSSCQGNRPQEPVERAFRVINCFKDSLEPETHAWGIKYVALSYVWGQDPQEDNPKTVLDAVVATREIGLQYLWVDRICIDQTNDDEKQYLISKMTTIYESAEMTIVAAAGDGSNYGLPGVGLTLRKPQPSYHLNSGSTLVSTLQDPRIEILESDYCRRGWTYQEGILSHRHLVFTDHQVYWECRCMATHESIHLPLPLVHESLGMYMSEFMLAGIFKSESNGTGVEDDTTDKIIGDDTSRLDYGFPINEELSVRHKLRALDEHIRSFSMRELSYDGDSLKAFLGIAGMYKSEDHIHLFLGIPLWIGEIVGGRSGPLITFALSVSAWYHRSSSTLSMFVSEPCPRRTHLPSWSWAGWKGTVALRSPPRDEHATFMWEMIEHRAIDVVWAPDIYLRDDSRSAFVCLKDVTSAQQLENNALRLIEIKQPHILKYSMMREVTEDKKTWDWARNIGRQGRESYHAGMQDWDQKWHRLAGRLVCISSSIPMTREQWTNQHYNNEIMSVLMFVARSPMNRNHGRAMFLTLRKVQSPTSSSPTPMLDHPRWERIGTVQLIVSDGELTEYAAAGQSSEGSSSHSTREDKIADKMFRKLPVRPLGQTLIIQ